MPLPSTLHLGFAKCGSTFLQTFWRNHPAVNMVFKAEFFAPLGASSFNQGPAHYAACFKKTAAKQHVLESDEHMLMGVFHPRLGVHSVTPASVDETCQRIKSVVPNVKLLMVVRNQLEMMVSTYSQYLLGAEHSRWISSLRNSCAVRVMVDTTSVFILTRSWRPSNTISQVGLRFCTLGELASNRRN